MPDSEVLDTNQKHTAGLLFEIDDEVTEFDFLFDMAHAGVEDETQTVSVTLTPVE